MSELQQPGATYVFGDLYDLMFNTIKQHFIDTWTKDVVEVFPEYKDDVERILCRHGLILLTTKEVAEEKTGVSEK